jgi:N-acetylglucosamine-6-sulfatase
VLNDNGSEVKKSGYITDLLTDYAAQWLKTRRADPFLLILSHKASHDPFTPAARHASAFADTALPEPASFVDSYFDKPAWQRRYVLCGGTAARLASCPDPPPPMLPPWGWPARDARRLDYLRTLLAVDDSVGTVVSTLDALGLTRSTYVLFVSDNGFFLGEHRLGDKRLMYEDSIRVPLAIAGGDLAPGRVASLALNIDLAPTILQLAGLSPPGTMQGRSLAGVLRREAAGVRDSLLYEYFPEAGIPGVPGIFGVRTTSWTYVTYPGLARDDELYDLDLDPDELTNLADASTRSGTKAELRAELERLLASSGGPSL